MTLPKADDPPTVWGPDGWLRDPPPVPPVRPVTVERSVVLWVLGSVCWAVGTLLGQLLHSSAAFVAYRSTATIPRGEPSTYTRTVAYVDALPWQFAVLEFVVVISALVVLVGLMGHGVNWARHALAGVGVLGGPLMLLRAGGELHEASVGGILRGGFAIVVIFAVVFAVPLMFQEPATAWFRAVRAFRARRDGPDSETLDIGSRPF
jgi:hypothetical protein